MKIDDVEIGAGFPPYIIAEMSGNHQGSLDKAMELLRKCVEAGANAFKLQTYTADSLTIDSIRSEYIVSDGPWIGRTLYDLYSQGHTPREWVAPLVQLGRSLGISVFSSPFSPEDVNFLASLEVPAYKVASFEINYEQLFTRIAKTQKPVIFSTGLATLQEIDEAIRLLRNLKVQDFAILKCTTSYPAEPTDLNLETIRYLSEKYQVPVGFSDHTKGFVASVSAVALGATIVEKHVKLDDDDTSVDSSFSLPVSQLQSFVELCREANKTIGHIQDGPTTSETGYLKYRRSIVAKRTIEQGQIISKDDLAIVRPNIGLAPKFFEIILGSRARVRIELGQGIELEMIQSESGQSKQLF
jgi:N-acetylneuraminate synthase